MILDAWRKYWARLDWVEELLCLSALALEACIIYPWHLLLGALFGHGGMPLWALFVLLWVPYAIASLISDLELRPDRRQALVVGLILLTALIVVRVHLYGGYAAWDVRWVAEMTDRLFDAFADLPPDLIVIVVVLIGWWRGIVAARKEYDMDRVWYRFRLGIILLVMYLGITIFGGRVDLTTVILNTFFFGLMSIALVRVSELGGIRQSTMGSKQWIALLAGSTLGNLALALLASLVFSRQAVRSLLRLFHPLIRLLERAVWYLVGFVLYLVWPLVDLVFRWVKAQLDGGGIGIQISPLSSPLSNPMQVLETGEGVNLAPYCRTISVVLIVVGGLLLVARAVRHLTRQRSKREDLERESLWAEQDLTKDLKNSLLQGWEQIKALASQLRGGHHRSVATIRKLYASMVDLATEAGYPRPPAQTPYEYRDTLYRAFAGEKEPVDAITEAYVRVHYGEVPGTRAEMDRLVQYWKQLQGLVVPRTGQGLS